MFLQVLGSIGQKPDFLRIDESNFLNFDQLYQISPLEVHLYIQGDTNDHCSDSFSEIVSYHTFHTTRIQCEQETRLSSCSMF